MTMECEVIVSYETIECGAAGSAYVGGVATIALSPVPLLVLGSLALFTLAPLVVTCRGYLLSNRVASLHCYL
jgi:hypothetical protein